MFLAGGQHDRDGARVVNPSTRLSDKTRLPEIQRADDGAVSGAVAGHRASLVSFIPLRALHTAPARLPALVRRLRVPEAPLDLWSGTGGAENPREIAG